MWVILFISRIYFFVGGGGDDYDGVVCFRITGILPFLISLFIGDQHYSIFSSGFSPYFRFLPHQTISTSLSCGVSLLYSKIDSFSSASLVLSGLKLT